MTPINRNRRAWTVFVVVALMGCGGNTAPSLGGDDGREAADKFLEAVRAGQFDSAWQATSTEFKSLMGLDSLRDLAKTRPALKGQPEFVESKRVDREGLPLVEHSYRARGKVRNKEVTSTLRVIVSKGDEGWKVEKLSVD